MKRKQFDLNIPKPTADQVAHFNRPFVLKYDTYQLLSSEYAREVKAQLGKRKAE